MVTVQNLIMRYGNRVLFQDINLKLDRHKRYGLIGANGAGKTTFLKILSGQINEYEGEVITNISLPASGVISSFLTSSFLNLRPVAWLGQYPFGFFAK